MTALQPMPHETPVRQTRRTAHNKLHRDEWERRRELVLQASRKVPSQRAMAKMLGVTQPDICRHLKGQRSVPKRCIQTLRELVEGQA